MDYELQLLNVPSGDLMTDGSTKINNNFEAIEDAINDLRTIAEATAGENLAEHQLVYVSGGEYFVATNNDTEAKADAMGITLEAISSGNTGTIQFGNGIISDEAWNWTPGAKLFLGEDGALVEDYGEATYVKQIGYAIDATSICFDVQIGYNSFMLGVLDPDTMEISYSPTNYTPALTPGTTKLTELGSHLKGIDDAYSPVDHEHVAADITDLGSFAEVIHTHTESDISDLGSYSLSTHDHAASYSAIGHSHNYAALDHDSSHVTGGSDEIDGDKLDIDWNPSNYTPATVISYSTNVDNLTSHLKGIDDEISTINSSLGNKLESIADNSVTLAKLEYGTQGDILYYGAAGAPARLGAGTSGYYLQTKGAGANPEWAEVVGGSSTTLTGSIVAFAGASVPEGYLECNGANVSRETYADLFSAIGTTWGSGDGSTTFTLPDLRRKTVVGAGGTGTATLGNAVGNSGGAETHTLSLAELAAHDHGGATGSHDHGGATGSHNHGGTTGSYAHKNTGYGTTNQTGFPQIQDGNTFQHSHTIPSGTASISSVTSTISSAGSGSAHNNMQPSAVVKMVIKT